MIRVSLFAVLMLTACERKPDMPLGRQAEEICKSIADPVARSACYGAAVGALAVKDGGKVCTVAGSIMVCP